MREERARGTSQAFSEFPTAHAFHAVVYGKTRLYHIVTKVLSRSRNSIDYVVKDDETNGRSKNS